MLVAIWRRAGDGNGLKRMTRYEFFILEEFLVVACVTMCKGVATNTSVVDGILGKKGFTSFGGRQKIVRITI